MPQLLDRYRRVSDGKEFAVVSLGAPTAEKGRDLTLEAEDGERAQSPAPTLMEASDFERIRD